MTGPSAPAVPPDVVRRVESPGAAALVGLTATFDDLQMVLRCCERLMTELGAGPDRADDVVVESVWTLALLSYGRCFAAERTAAALTEADLTAAHPDVEILEWHRVLLQLRDHHAHPTENPRERFFVGVAQGEDGGPTGVAITSTRQPPVDELTVRQTGGVAFTMSAVVNDRITAQQAVVFNELKAMSKADLETLAKVDVARSGETTPDPSS